MSSSSEEDVLSPPYDESDEVSATEPIDDEIDELEDDENAPSDDIQEPMDADDDIDLDLEGEEDLPKPRRGTSARTNRAPVKKRTLALYNEDEDSTDGTETPQPGPQAARRQPLKRQRVSNVDEELILTDEEAEYDPHSNPDVSKMTERQRRRFLEEENGNSASDLFIELDDLDKKNTKRKQETEQETMLRKAESARRRQHLKNKQLEEEKQDTVNKLLKRRATKTRANENKEEHEEVLVLRPRRPMAEHAALSRWVSKREGEVLGYE